MQPTRRKPSHPGHILQEEFLKPLFMTPRQFADQLGGDWTELKIEAIIKGKESISDEAAKAFALILNTPVEFWQRLQQAYATWEHRQRQNEKGSLKPWKKAQ